MSTPPARLRDIPSLERDGSNLKAWADAISEAVQTFRGYRGDALDKALTLRDARTVGLLDQFGNPAAGGGGTTIILPGGGGGGGPYTPDLTPPPAPTGLTLTSGLAGFFVEWDAPTYTVGHGHKKTNVYGCKFATGGSPVFADAVRIDEAWDARTITALVSELGTNWAIWIKFETVDGVEGSPAGGANGAQVTIGKIGNADLGPLIVEAQNIAAKAVDVSKMTVIDFSTIADNPTFEAGDVGWDKAAGWTIINSPSQAFMGSWVAYTPGGVPQALRNQVHIPVVQGDEFYAEAMGKVTPNTGGAGVCVRLSGRNAAGAEIWTPAGNFVTSATYTGSALSATVPANVVSVNVEVVSLSNAGSGVYADNVRFQRKLTLNHLAAGSIAVGSAAIANGAIVNAMIGTAAIDDAKVANLSASKLTVGDGTIGGLLKSSNYVAGTSGWVVMPNGFAEFGFAAIRGVLLAGQIGANTITTDKLFAGATMGGAYTGYAWPAAGAGGGFYLGPQGLLLGSYYDGKYFQVSAAGDIYAPGFSIINGNATFGGILTAANVVTTNNLVPGAVTTAITGFVGGTGRSVTSTTSRSTTRSIGSITTASPGAGRVSLTLSPQALSSNSAWWIFSYLLAEASLTDNGSNITISFRVKRTIGASTVIVWQLTTVNAVTSGTSTRFCPGPIILDTPGPGVTATYVLEIITSTDGAATNMAHEIVDFNFILIETKA